LLIPDADGRLKLPLSSSPEIHDASLAAWLAPNSNYDLALLRALYADLEAMARARGLADDAREYEETLARLDDFDLDVDGALTFARGEPYRASHRHFSHALAIHPLGLLTIEGTPAERRIVDATLDGIVDKGTSEWCGYSFSWFACMLARCGRPESALRYLQDFERAFTLRNGFHCNGDQSGEGLSKLTYRPFTLEGNMLAMEAVHEMLMQSWGGIVRVFPAVSRTWSDVSFGDLRAEGGFRVSASRAGGRTIVVRVQATRAGELRLRDPFGGSTPKWSRGVERKGDEWVVRLRAGEDVTGSIDPSVGR
jgi:alpha-L-fucosidase 2